MMRLPAFLRSSSARFFVLVFVIQLVSGASLLLVVRYIIASELDRTSRTLVTSLRDDLIADYREEGVPGLRELIAGRLGGMPSRDAAVLLDDPGGNRLAGNIADWPPPVPFDAGWRVLSLYRMGRDHPEQMGVLATRLPDGNHLLVGHVIEGDLRTRRLIGEAMVAALLLAVPLALLGAIVATRVVTASVERVVETANAFGSGDLSRRVPIEGGGSGDAFALLGGAINVMLGRIETLVSELRLVTDSLAHDLRSPLTRLRATIERAVREIDDEAALAALDRVSDEAQALLAMLSTALQISRAEAGIGRDRFVRTDLRRMIDDLAEMYGPLAEEGGFLLSASGTGIGIVHRELLGQALANLIDNAMKYGRGGAGSDGTRDGAGGEIRLWVRSAGNRLTLGVDDDGPGIPADRRDEALRRFGRLDPARGAAGAGLGLALVVAVGRLHRGEIALADNAPGLSVRIHLPAVDG